ncbi:MAG: methyltransferase domain-containing protein [Myxococcales bacterium]|nr:methyltransferase domain-containing protein [Myxococcales bacterium]
MPSDGDGSLGWPEPAGWPTDTSRDQLIGDWYLYQRKGGHRTSTDDLITAWYAVHRTPISPKRYLDLGCGIGSVMLMVSHKLRPTSVWGVEAQPQSFAMASRTIEELPENTCEFSLEHSDFRSVDFGDSTFDLITGSPPYFPLGTGVLPDDAQRRACRFEARGGVEAYLQAADRVLSAVGRLYLVFQTQWTSRVLEAADGTALSLTGQADFLMRSDREQPFLSVYEFSRSPVKTLHRFSCPVRDHQGEVSEGYQAIRNELGL